MRILKLLAVLPIIGVLAAWLTWGRQAVFLQVEEESRQRAIVAQVRGLIPDAPSPSGRSLPRRGKVLIWDLQADRRSGGHAKLPPELQACSTDAPITLVIVTRVSREQTATYDNGDPGYRQQATVDVIYWPAKAWAGRFVIDGDDPPTFVIRSSGGRDPVLGEIDEPLADWAAAPSPESFAPPEP